MKNWRQYMNRARDIEFTLGIVSGGIRLYPYQFGFGISIAFWPCIKRPEVSLYVGPLKFWCGISGERIFRFFQLTQKKAMEFMKTFGSNE